MFSGVCISCGDISILNRDRKCVRCLNNDEADEALDKEIQNRIARELDEKGGK